MIALGNACPFTILSKSGIDGTYTGNTGNTVNGDMGTYYFFCVDKKIVSTAN